MSPVTDVFLGISRKFSEQLCQRTIIFSCGGYSRRNGCVTERLNQKCFKFSNTYHLQIYNFLAPPEVLGLLHRQKDFSEI